MPYFPDPGSTSATITGAVALEGIHVPPSGSSTGPVVRPLAQSATGSLSSLSASMQVTLLMAKNTGRVGLSLFNDSTSNLYLRLAPSASFLPTDFSIKMNAGSYYELPEPCYTGEVSGFWTAANGVVRITEYTS